MKRLISSKPRQNTQQGFTLLELLIAVVIASISVLGLAYTQTKSLQYARSSSQYTRTSIVASNTVEQMWALLCTSSSIAEIKNDLPAVENGFERTISAPDTSTDVITITVSDLENNRFDDVDNDVTVKVIFPEICP